MNKTSETKSRLMILAAGILCAFCLMIVFLITSVEAVAYWTPGYYESEYIRYEVLDDLPEMTMEDLLDVTHEMMAYLRGRREDFHVYTHMGGEYREFFTPREIAHMEDVRGLFIGGLRLRRIGLLLICLTAISLFFWQKKAPDRKYMLAARLPAALCLGTGVFFTAALILAGIISTDFSRYFIVFHHIFFDNDLWILDPAEDMLINIVPEPFFMDTALRIAITFGILVLAFLIICLYLWKHNHMKKPLCFLLCLALLISVQAPDQALAATGWPSDVSVQADGAILMDARSGAILFEKNSRESYYPASITKILTALIIIQNCDLDDIVTFSSSAVNSLESGASILGARVGDKMSVRDCLYALLLQSANEVANALAEHCSGSIDAFSALMNRTAASLGCVNSNFVNPSGLNDENHYTCAYDMALIAQAAFSDPVFVEIDSTTWYDVPAGQLKQYPNGWRYYAHHRMLKKNDSLYYNGIIGGKTGYTSLAGNTLVTCAERDGLKLVAVVLNGHQTHYTDTKALLDFGFQNFKSVVIADKDSTYQKIEQDLAINGIIPGDTIRLSINKDSVVTLPSEGDFSDVTSSLNYDLTDPSPDTAIACIEYLYQGRKVGHAYLEATVIPGFIPSQEELSETPEPSGEARPEAAPAEEIVETQKPEAGKTPFLKSSVFSILKKVLFLISGLGAIGAVIFGLLSYREHKEQKERILRQQRRENRLRKWGYSTTEFDKIMEEHIRSRSASKKPSFRDRFRKK